eukprot:1149653-Pelagomonas_calceolata.AAC.10
MKPSRCSPPKAELKSWPSSGACWRSTGGSGGGGGMDGTGGKASDCWRGMQNALSGPPTGVPPAPEAGAGRLAASMSPICSVFAQEWALRVNEGTSHEWGGVQARVLAGMHACTQEHNSSGS